MIRRDLRIWGAVLIVLSLLELVALWATGMIYYVYYLYFGASPFSLDKDGAWLVIFVLAQPVVGLAMLGFSFFAKKTDLKAS